MSQTANFRLLRVRVSVKNSVSYPKYKELEFNMSQADIDVLRHIQTLYIIHLSLLLFGFRMDY